MNDIRKEFEAALATDPDFHKRCDPAVAAWIGYRLSLRTPSAAGVVPEGWKLVPVEPVQEQLDAVLRVDCDGMPASYRTIYTIAVGAAPAAPIAQAAVPFQQRVQPWMMECFGPEISADAIERNHRFFEEATELVQSTGMTANEAHQLVDYVYSRPVGKTHQEVGGAMVTLAALCLAQSIDMHEAGETELLRIWQNVDKIRAKQAAKPKHSPLPGAAAPAEQGGETCSTCHGSGWYVVDGPTSEADGHHPNLERCDCIAPAPHSGEAGGAKFFVYCPEGGYEEYETDAERQREHQLAIDQYLDEAGWSDQVAFVVSGIATHVTVKTDEERKPPPCANHPEQDEEGCEECGAWQEWPHDFDTTCAYVPEAVAAQPQAAPSGLSDDPGVEAFLAEVRAELIRARKKFPGDRVMTIALAEEFGELCKAVLDESAANVRKEAVQTSVMCARVVLDGDGSVNEWREAKGLDALTGGVSHGQ